MTTYFDDAKLTFDTEIDALKTVRETLDDHFDDVINAILNTNGRVLFVAIGKSGLIAEKIAASLSSIGLSSFFIDAGSAFHGDLGRVSADDLVIFVSNSGETQEVIQTLFALKNIHKTNLKTVAITGSEESTLARETDILLKVDVAEEADTTKLAPTSSTTATLVMGDAILIAIEKAQEFKREDFALYHPGGSIGKMLLRDVQHSMHTKIPYVHIDTPINDVIYRISDFGVGMTLVKSSDDKVIGIVTDGDIRKKFLYINQVKGSTAEDYMTEGFININQTARNTVAWKKMAANNISNLVVNDDDDNVVGIITIHDVLD
ncbi:KpsF/GutQ family sugar-phosphate isomerase [Leuconostoc miyukkimchii]|uniref:KpsF/GutQ family sugar-phosphate isomerase n=1 Tax=Leuconostoc miyukkimchii TaxID=910540 RepID=UPI001C7D6F3A|nr:KpsF/GutQ family sugar-phosphate isomerase [Leuconostoc miyukkimchii]